MGEAAAIETSDGETLEAELHLPDSPAAAVVITHPHPKMGGDMHTPVPAAMFRACESLGVAALRFNFRGAGRSTGTHDEGGAEQLDVAAAIDHLAGVAPDVPLLLAGWSFGADMILTSDDERIVGRFLAAAPLRVVDASTMAARSSADPKIFAVPENDQFAPPATVEETLAEWTNATIEIITGGDHFFSSTMPALMTQFTGFVQSM